MKVFFLIPLLVLATAASAMPPRNPVSQYISAYLPYALEEMRETGIPASIKLAMAVEESGHGTSRLAREQNNHFGIINPRRRKPSDDKFKTYDSVKSSYEDNSTVLLNKKRCRELISRGVTDFREWIKVIAKIGYAADGWDYARKLTAHIERYDLDRYDNGIRTRATRYAKVPQSKPAYTLGW